MHAARVLRVSGNVCDFPGGRFSTPGHLTTRSQQLQVLVENQLLGSICEAGYLPSASWYLQRKHVGQEGHNFLCFSASYIFTVLNPCISLNMSSRCPGHSLFNRDTRAGYTIPSPLVPVPTPPVLIILAGPLLSTQAPLSCPKPHSRLSPEHEHQ